MSWESIASREYLRGYEGLIERRCTIICVERRVRNHLGKTTLSTPDQDSTSDLPVIGSLIQHESSALDHAATKAGLNTDIILFSVKMTLCHAHDWTNGLSFKLGVGDVWVRILPGFTPTSLAESSLTHQLRQVHLVFDSTMEDQ
ncbi:unnamed protein product [Timema podura]|uniref:Uncharacterized protein n=1 Tax=Timema podura TaxID=61482 RepID=A0ABN7NAJ3_TIMPD|nr:unnamed protein product [Timema podura]